uniref:DUF1985 domain-containing protein n=1 Tax=Brassica oleracea var. oleracea TaxID=109376 RepID=A0A0D3CAR9_BRAOL
MLGFQLAIKKKYELWSLVGPQPVRFSLLEFENLTGLNCEYNEDLERPHSVVAKELTSFWEMLGVHTRVINFVQKDISQMFPKWEFDVEDTPAKNIIKLMFVKKLWKWTMDCWEVTGTWVNTKPAVVSPAKKNVVKEDSLRPRKKARKEAPAEASEGVAAEASEEEIKYLSERVEAVEKKVGITIKRKGTSSQNRGTGTSYQNTISPPKNTLEPGTLIGYYCLKWIFGYYCINPSCILHSESVNGTNAGRKSLAEYKGPDVPAAVPADASSSKDKAPEPSLVLLDKNHPIVSDLQKEDARYQEKRDAALALFRAKSDRTRKLAASQQSPYTANSTARVIIPNKKLYPGYNPFAPIDKKKLKELADWLKTCHYYRAPIDKKPRKSRTWWYQILRTSLQWLENCHIDACINVLRKRYSVNPQHFRSERMCFLDHLFAQQWRFNFKDFKDSEPDQNGLGRRLPGGVWNYYAGTIPSFCQPNKVLEYNMEFLEAFGCILSSKEVFSVIIGRAEHGSDITERRHEVTPNYLSERPRWSDPEKSLAISSWWEPRTDPERPIRATTPGRSRPRATWPE